MFFKSKQRKIEGLLAEYRHQIVLCLDEFKKVFGEFHATGDRVKLENDVAEIHVHESKADDIRRSIEDMMYTQALFPESRGDILGLLETMDKVPNMAQTVVRMVVHQRIDIPPELWPQVLELVDLATRCVGVMLEASDKLFSDFTGATVAIGKVDELESRIDHVLDLMIRRIFAGPFDGVHKLLLRDLAYSIESISDRSQDTTDRIRIIVAKRKF